MHIDGNPVLSVLVAWMSHPGAQPAAKATSPILPAVCCPAENREDLGQQIS